MNLFELKPKESDVKKTIEEFLEMHENFDCVMLVALNKDGTQFMQSSTMNQFERSFLSQFVQSSIFWWFRDINNDA